MATSFTHTDESIRTVLELMDGTTERTRMEICGIVRNYIFNATSTAKTEQKAVGRTGTHAVLVPDMSRLVQVFEPGHTAEIHLITDRIKK